MTEYQKKIDLSGQKFGKLLAIKRSGNKSSSGGIKYNCICECGNKTEVEANCLRKGRTKSCGCLQLESAIKHGMYGTVEHKCWTAIYQRCNNPNSTSFKDYGARGITMCDRWKDDKKGFLNFFEDMGKRPSKNHSIERNNVNGNYEPDNCRWATSIEQGRNKTNSKFYTYDNQTKCASEWCQIYNIPRSTFENRMIKGWSIEKTLETKIRFKSK